jgi:ferredoxin-type protein NapH
MREENPSRSDSGSERSGGLRARIRTIRWLSQLAFLALFLILITGTVCTVILGNGLVISEPFGALQLVFASSGSSQFFSALTQTFLIGVVIFVVIVILVGRAFCAWACPVGTATDLIEAGLQRLKFKPFFTRSKRGEDTSSAGLLRSGMNKYAVMAAGLAGSALFRFPAWCVFCPIGTLCRGSAAGTELVIGAEILTVPAVGVMSLGEKRFWCRYLCPVGGALTLLSQLNPFIKPSIRQDARHRDCGACRTICPEGIDICKEKSFARCTKCFECYSKCPFGSVRIRLT